MMRLAAGALAILLAAGPSQDAAKIDALIKNLDHPDWVEQAKAAKDLAAIGRPGFDALRDAASGPAGGRARGAGDSGFRAGGDRSRLGDVHLQQPQARRLRVRAPALSGVREDEEVRVRLFREVLALLGA